jgi:hypothetical protein
VIVATMDEGTHSLMSLDPPQWSPLTEPSLDDENVAGSSLDQRQAEDWIDWMKWDEKDGNETSGGCSTPRIQTQMLTPDTQESEKMSTGSSSPRGSNSELASGSPRSHRNPGNLITTTSASTVFSNPSPNTTDSRSSLESVPGSLVVPGMPPKSSISVPFNATAGSKKRKSTAEDTNALVSTPAESRGPPAPKRPHNMVERRYRNNLNEKIAALRDSVPSLRVRKTFAQDVDGTEIGDARESSDSAQKLNKGSILSKATEYINHLELRARRLDEENLALKTRLRHLEKLIEQRDMTAAPIEPKATSDKTDKTLRDGLASPAPDPPTTRPSSPHGLIPVPESFRRMRRTSPQPHYADSYIRDLDGEDVKEGKPHGKFMNRLMIGSLAGLMVVDTWVTKREPGERSNVQGLLAIPVDLISTFANWIHLSEASSLFPLGHLHAGLLPVVRFFLALNILAFIVFVYLFSSKPINSKKPYAAPLIGADLALSLSSPIHIRRQAWLTSIQTVWVPRHTILIEFIATTLEALKYFIRCLVGWPIYSRLTGRTESYEVARRKAVDILIDSQLAGGDPEISRSRLVLTIFASGTLPNTPLRLMVKALHARIILWRVGRSGSFPCRLADAAAKKVARYQWGFAQRLAKSQREEFGFHESHDALPSYLVKLLRCSCDEVLNDSIVQRAYNLAWDRPASEGIDGDDSSMNIVTEDTAIRSPLDAVAAWWSTSLLNGALLKAIGNHIDDSNLVKLLDDSHSAAPTSSVAQIRSQAARAIFVKKDRISSINHLLDALPPYKSAYMHLQSSPYVPASNIFASELPALARDEVRHATTCAILIALLENTIQSSLQKDLPMLLQKALLRPKDISLLGFVASRQLLNSIQTSNKHYLPKLEAQILQSLRIWARNEAEQAKGGREELFQRASKLFWIKEQETEMKRIRRWSNDTGYGTQSDSD